MSDSQVPELVRRIVDGLPEAAVVLDGSRRVVYWNALYAFASGLGNREILRRSRRGVQCHDLFQLEICQEKCLVQEAARLGRPLRMDEIRAVRADGQELTLIVTATPLDHDFFVEIYRDVTADARIQAGYKELLALERRAKERLEQEVAERTRQLREANQELKQAQATLVHQEKMSSLGRLAAGIAHELNNPISFVYGNIEFMEEYFESLLRLVALYEAIAPREVLQDERVQSLKEEIEYDYLLEDARKLLASIRSGAERTAAIVRDLRTFSRSGSGDLEPTDLVQGLKVTLNLLRPAMKDRIHVELDLEALPPVVCHAGHMNQVFMNILQNAVDAIEGEGVITVRARRTKEGVRFEFEDTGCGIPAEDLDKLFEPFFTTKDVGKGTGLGLAICDGIVRRHGGRITVRSDVGRGTTFVVELPLEPPPEAPVTGYLPG